MDKKQVLILVLSCLVLFLLGISLGITIQANNRGAVKKAEAVNNLSSKVITSITAYGKITKIDGKKITLSNLGEDLSILMQDKAKIYSFNVSEKSNVAPTQKEVGFGDVKVGDSVNVVMKLLSDGQMQGSSLIILPVSK